MRKNSECASRRGHGIKHGKVLFLQASLVAFFRDLPVNRLGPWVVTGWAGAFTEPDAVADYATLKSDWGEASDNKILATAAKAAGKVQAGKGRGR